MDVLSDSYTFYDEPISKPFMQGSNDSPQSPQSLEKSVDRGHRNARTNESWVSYINPTGAWNFGLDRVFDGTVYPMADPPNTHETG